MRPIPYGDSWGYPNSTQWGLGYVIAHNAARTPPPSLGKDPDDIICMQIITVSLSGAIMMFLFLLQVHC